MLADFALQDGAIRFDGVGEVTAQIIAQFHVVVAVDTQDVFYYVARALNVHTVARHFQFPYLQPATLADALLGDVDFQCFEDSFDGLLRDGLANQVVLPYVIAYNSTDERSAYLYARLLHSIGLAPEIGKTATETLIRMIVQLSTDMDMALCLKDLGIDEGEYLESKESLVEKAMIDTCTATNPIKPTREDMLRILDSIYYGK